MKNTLKTICFLLLLPLISGCAVGMALSGKPDTDVSALRIGQPRDEVIMIIGQPIKTMSTETGRMDVFKCQRGNAPSGGRAIGHAVMDWLTLGVWEIIGTPVEAMSGETFYLTVNYDKEDKVTKFKTSKEQGGLN